MAGFFHLKPLCIALCCSSTRAQLPQASLQYSALLLSSLDYPTYVSLSCSCLKCPDRQGGKQKSTLQGEKSSPKSSSKKFTKKFTQKVHQLNSPYKFTKKVHLKSSPKSSSKKFTKKFTQKVHQKSSPKKFIKKVHQKVYQKNSTRVHQKSSPKSCSCLKCPDGQGRNRKVLYREKTEYSLKKQLCAPQNIRLSVGHPVI